MMNFGGSYTAPLSLVIDKNTAATTILVNGVAGKLIRVHSLRLNVAGAVIVTLLDSSATLERWNFAGNGGGVILDMREIPYWSTTASANNLRITLSAAVQVDGMLEYTQS